LGEVRDAGSKNSALMLKPYIVGANPLDITGVLRRIRSFAWHGRQGGGYSAVDLALHDIVGKVFGVPVWRLLGDKKRDRIRIYCDTAESKDPKIYAQRMMERRKNGYTLPPVTLLDAPKDHRKIDERELMDAARLLEEKCKECDVVGQVVQIHPGPVVTTYEFKPDPGVKYSRITGLADDLCLAMQAESVLIDRIPGKSTVGIQIPNPVREGITLRELLESDTYTRSASKLSIAMGKTIHGEPFVSDLATMPHLLIAGSTGAGKSVSVNAMVSSILFRSTPEDVRFIMIDPKRLELGMY